MPNDKPGDHALSDILVHGREVYGPEADDLIRGISEFSSKYELYEWWNAEIKGCTDPDEVGVDGVAAAVDGLEVHVAGDGIDARDLRVVGGDVDARREEVRVDEIEAPVIGDVHRATERERRLVHVDREQ